MRTVPLTVAVLCAAALSGLTSPRAPAAAAADTPPRAPGAHVAVKPEDPQDVSAAQPQPAGQERVAGQESVAGQKSMAGQEAAARPVDSSAEARRETHARSGRPGSQRASEPARRPLDLSAPPVSHVMTPEQVQELTEQPDDNGPEEVTVQEHRYEAPVPRGQIRALAWALMHPLQAWRIFTPVTDQ